MRFYAMKKVGSEEARLPESIPSWCQEGGKGGGKPPPRGVGGSEERKKRRKEEGKKGRREERRVGRKARCSTRSPRWVGGFMLMLWRIYVDFMMNFCWLYNNLRWFYDVLMLIWWWTYVDFRMNAECHGPEGLEVLSGTGLDAWKCLVEKTWELGSA